MPRVTISPARLPAIIAPAETKRPCPSLRLVTTSAFPVYVCPVPAAGGAEREGSRVCHTPHISRPWMPGARAAWQRQLAADTRPGLLPALGRCPPELLPRFATYYTQLRALPRRVRRALQRQWRLPLAGVALMLALGQHPGLAATIPVGGACTLVDAITAANTDTATGGCPAGSGADTIVLPAGSTQTLTEVNNDTYGPTGLPVISSVITIAGQGSTIARESAAPEFRLLR